MFRKKTVICVVMVAFLLFTLLALGGCGLFKRLIITGRIITVFDDTYPVHNAEIRYGGSRARSDHDGEFRLNIRQQDPGDITITISRDGFLDKDRDEFIYQDQTRLDVGTITIFPEDPKQAAAYGKLAAMSALAAAPVELPDKPLPGYVAIQSYRELPLFEEAVDEIIVRFREGTTTLNEIQTLHQEAGVTDIRTYEHSGLQVVRVPSGTDIYELIGYYEDQPQVLYAEPNAFVFPQSTRRVPNDEHYKEGYQWNLELLNMERAWGITTGSKHVRVAVLDTGLLHHVDLFPLSDFSDRSNINWFLAKDIIDGGKPFDTGAVDFNSHGTHVTGIIGAITNNDEGIAGVAWKVDIVPVRVMGATSGRLADTVAGIEYAVSKGADIIYIGFSTKGDYTSLREACEEAYEKGVTLIAPAGNTHIDYFGTILYPARYETVISVGAVDKNDRLTDYSARGVDVLAPGGAIDSWDNPSGGILSTTGLYDQTAVYGYMEGTSMAAAHITGIAALMVSSGAATGPDSIMRGLIQAGNNYPHRSAYRGYGLVDAFKAVQPAELEPVVFAGYQEGDTIYSEFTYTYAWDTEEWYQLWQIKPADRYLRIYAWVDIDGDGEVNPGDFFAYSEIKYFQSGHRYRVDLPSLEFQILGEEFKPLKVNRENCQNIEE